MKLWLVCQNVPIWAFQNVNTETTLLAYVKNRINGSKKLSKTLPNFSTASQATINLPYPLVLLGGPFLRIGMSAADGELFTLVLGQSCFETSVKPVYGKTIEFHPLFTNYGWAIVQGSHSDWKTWKNGKAFSSQGKVREFWTDWKSQGKVRENHTKYWKTQGIWDKYYLIFLVIVKWTVYYLLKWIKFSVKKIKH